MKKIYVLLLAAAITGICSAHATDLFKVNGVIYGDNTSPFSEYFNPSVKPAKMGEATCTSYFRIITLGACGINDAMENGKITRVNSIDKHSKNILLFHKATLRVYGE